MFFWQSLRSNYLIPVWRCFIDVVTCFWGSYNNDRCALTIGFAVAVLNQNFKYNLRSRIFSLAHEVITSIYRREEQEVHCICPLYTKKYFSLGMQKNIWINLVDISTLIRWNYLIFGEERSMSHKIYCVLSFPLPLFFVDCFLFFK